MTNDLKVGDYVIYTNPTVYPYLKNKIGILDSVHKKVYHIHHFINHIVISPGERAVYPYEVRKLTKEELKSLWLYEI